VHPNGVSMKKRLLLAAAVVALASCTSGTTSPITPVESSSGGTSSATHSSGVSGSSTTGGSSSSSSYTPLPEVDSSAVAGPTNLKVSTYVAPNTMVLTWSDVALSRTEYSGYKVYRNENYNGWDSIGVAAPDQQFFKDTGLSTEYMAIYRIIAYKVRAGKTDTLVSLWSNEAGVVPVSTLGFGSVVFDQADSVSTTRWAPSVYEMAWPIAGLKPELGWVIQGLGSLSEYQGDTLDNGDTILTSPLMPSDSFQLTTEGYWYNLDTLSESNNHYILKGYNPYNLYRIYAYYSDEFGRLISEFSNETSTKFATYNPSIAFTPPVLYASVGLVKIKDNTLNTTYSCKAADTTVDSTCILQGYRDSTYVDFSWNPTHSGIDPIDGVTKYGNSYTKKLYWEYELVDGINSVHDTLSTIQTAFKRPNPTGGLCSVSLRVRLVWTDIYGYTDKSAWSVQTGTKPGTTGNLTDKGKLCKE